MPRKKRAKYSNGGSIRKYTDGIIEAYNNLSGHAGASGGSGTPTRYGAEAGTKGLKLRAEGSSLNKVPTRIGARITRPAKDVGTWSLDTEFGTGSAKGTGKVAVERTTPLGTASAIVRRQPKPFSRGKETFMGIQFTKEL